MNVHTVKILLVEDNPADARLTEEALKGSSVPNMLQILKDGEVANEFLTKAAREAPDELPDIILLDLNLPKVDGRQLLSIIKSNKQLKNIPVIVLTTSTAERDILQAYDAHCNCYLTKPVDFDKFSELIDIVKSFWLSVVRLPRISAY